MLITLVRPPSALVFAGSEASGGGGGMGMQVVSIWGTLRLPLRAQAVADAAFANGGLSGALDRKPRHIEYQILADERGNAMRLYERGTRCSVGTKAYEESPAPGIDAKVLCEQAQRGADICARLGYNNWAPGDSLQ